jgi:hypothetical protein
MIKYGLKASLAAVSAALLLVACGGDTTVTGVQPVPFKAEGTVATGIAAADGTAVTVTCASGSPVTDSVKGGLGKYSISITGGVAPCVLTATLANGTVLKSITQAATPGADTIVVANLNPLTTAVVDALLSLKTNGTSKDITQLVKSATATPTQTEIDTVVANTVTAVRAAQTEAGTSASGLLPSGVNLLTDTLDASPASGSNPGGGNAYDDALDALKTAAIVTSTGVLKTSVVDTIKSTSDSVVNPTSTTGAVQ